MAVRSLRGIKPIFWKPPTYSSNYKFVVIRDDDTEDDITDLIVFLEVEDGTTDKIGRFEFQIWDPNEDYNGVWVGKETVKYYKDYAPTATTLRFRGKTEKVSYQGNKLKVTGRSEALAYMDLTVTKSYDNEPADSILKAIIDAYSTGFTYTNIDSTSVSLTVNWVQKPFWDCVEELCRATGYFAYVDANKDWHFKLVGSINNDAEAIVHDSNLLSLGDFAEDVSQIKNRIIVYGANQDGIQILYTAEDTTSQSTYGTKEIIVNDDNITDYDQAEEYGNFLLSENQDPPIIGDVTAPLMATIQPGQKIKISSPSNNLPPEYYESTNYKDKIDLGSGMGLTTTVTISKEPQMVSDVFKKIIESTNQQKKTASNPYEMRHSFNFLFDTTSGTHTSTEVSNGVLKTTSGNSVGNWVSETRTLSTDIDSAYLIIVGTVLTGVTVEISGDGGTTYQSITNKELITMSTAKGSALKVKVSFTDENSEVDSVSILYTRD